VFHTVWWIERGNNIPGITSCVWELCVCVCVCEEGGAWKV